MTRRTQLALLLVSLLSATARSSAGAEAWGPELAAQTLITVVSDNETKGAGTGLGVAVGASLPMDALADGARGVVRLRANLLVAGGLIGTTELEVALRLALHGRWQPELGVSVWFAFGALVRTIDPQGQLASNPWAPLLALDALRFDVGSSWLSIAAVRAGPTLFHSGNPPLVISLTLLQVGREF